MRYDKDDMICLLHTYVLGLTTPEEQCLVEAYLTESESYRLLLEEIEDSLAIRRLTDAVVPPKHVREHFLRMVAPHTPIVQVVATRKTLNRNFLIPLLALILSAMAVLFFRDMVGIGMNYFPSCTATEVEPGGDRVTLALTADPVIVFVGTPKLVAPEQDVQQQYHKCQQLVLLLVQRILSLYTDSILPVEPEPSYIPATGSCRLIFSAGAVRNIATGPEAGIKALQPFRRPVHASFTDVPCNLPVSALSERMVFVRNNQVTVRIPARFNKKLYCAALLRQAILHEASFYTKVTEKLRLVKFCQQDEVISKSAIKMTSVFIL